MNNNATAGRATYQAQPAPQIQTDGLVDPSAVAVALSRRLFAAGVPVTPSQAVNFAHALTLVNPVSRRRLYFTARAVFVSGPADLSVFDDAFASVCGEPDDA